MALLPIAKRIQAGAKTGAWSIKALFGAWTRAAQARLSYKAVPMSFASEVAAGKEILRI
jgi:hypothetical protein